MQGLVVKSLQDFVAKFVATTVSDIVYAYIICIDMWVYRYMHICVYLNSCPTPDAIVMRVNLILYHVYICIYIHVYVYLFACLS